MATHQFIPDTWKQWIATNLLLEQPAEELVKVLTKNGFSVDLARLHPWLCHTTAPPLGFEA